MVLLDDLTEYIGSVNHMLETFWGFFLTAAYVRTVTNDSSDTVAHKGSANRYLVRQLYMLEQGCSS